MADTPEREELEIETELDVEKVRSDTFLSED